MAGLAFAVGGTAITQLLQGVAQDREASRHAQLLEKLGILAAEDERRKTNKVIGATIARAAGQGRDPTSGSALDIALESQVEGSVAERRAQFGFDAAASAAKARGRAAMLQGITGAVGTVLGGTVRGLGQNPSTTPTAANAGAFSRNNSAGGPPISSFQGVS